MTVPVVATLCLKSTGQTLELKQDATLLIGRGTFTGITSTHISLQLSSTPKGVTVTRLGTNRSFWDGKSLPKDTAVLLQTAGILTLVETEFPIAIDILSQESETNKVKKSNNSVLSKEQDQEMEMEMEKSIAASKVDTPLSSVLRSPPPSKSPSHVIPSSSVKSPPSSEKVAPDTSDQDIEMDNNRKSNGSESEDTSDSDTKRREDQVLQDNSNVSIESSIICEDLSELDSSIEEIRILN
ncbi:hypothetical protein BGX27_000088 [Mortierella sp. AM989]|nr:hypothetical protein BGX27_000088 [Mortierella sp. AM989]